MDCSGVTVAKPCTLLGEFLAVLVPLLLPAPEHQISWFYQLLPCHYSLINTRTVSNLEGRYTSSDAPGPPAVQVG